MYTSAASSDTPVGLLLQTVFNSILQVFLLCLAGYILAAQGILDKRTQKQLNRLNVSLFTPALLFSKVAFFLTPEKLKELYVIPIFFLVVTAISMITAQLLGWAFRLKRSQRAFATAAAMFMNSNSLPIALMQSLVVTVPHLKWGDDDNHDAMVGRALTYLVLYSTLGMVLRWSYGVQLLAQADEEVTPSAGSTDPENVTERTPLLSQPSKRTIQKPTGLDLPPAPTATITAHESSSPLPSVSVLPSTPHAVVSSPSPIEESPALPTQGLNGNFGSTGLRPPAQRRRTTTFYHSFPNTPNASTHSVNLPHFRLASTESDLVRTPSQSSLSSTVSGYSSLSEDEDEAQYRYNPRTPSSATMARTRSPSPVSGEGSETVADADEEFGGDEDSEPNNDRPLPNKVKIAHTEPQDGQSSPEQSRPPMGKRMSTRKSTRPKMAKRSSTYRSTMSQSHPSHKSLGAKTLKFIRLCLVWIKQFAKKVHTFMTVPLYAAALSLIVACVQPLQHVLEVHAWPIKGALSQAGSVSIPMTLVVLGAYFYSPPQEGAEPISLKQRVKNALSYFKPSHWRSGHLGESAYLTEEQRIQQSDEHERMKLETRGETKTVVIAIVSRMVITPVVVLPLMVVSTVFDLQRVFDDPVFVVSNVLLISSPPALTLAQITQAASGDAFERLIARTIFWAYCVITPPATILYVVIGLVLSRL